MSVLLPAAKNVIITGDVTVDWNLIYFQGAQDSTALWNASSFARACPQAGGAALLAELFQALNSGKEKSTELVIAAPRLPDLAISSSDRRYNHSYSIWEQLGEKERKGWRVSRFLGIDPATEEDLPHVEELPGSADLILLDDANLGFRRSPARWPAALQNQENRPWVVLKLSHPVASGELLEKLVSEVDNRVVAVVTADDLRLSNAQISRGISWERIAQDTLWEITYNPELSLLSKCAHVIVSFRTDGAAIISRQEEDLHCELVFDPNTIENGWASGYKGGVVGYNTCLAAAVAWKLLQREAGQSSEHTELRNGVIAGLSSMRALLSKGYQSKSQKPLEARISFPFSVVAEEINHPGAQFAHSDVHSPLGRLTKSIGVEGGTRSGMFTILSQQCCGDLLTLARAIVKNGPEIALTNIPLGRFGKLKSVDRGEIESYRTIAALIQEYINQEKLDKPISIAVFGAPGSGKSFGIKEIANSLSDRIKEITFNLSQMNSPDDLIGALHQVRDEALRGKIPLVFWDEFDSSLAGMPLGWLRYFLAPMQDGSFLEGQVTHPIGRAIFVFAGGTCERIGEFGRRLSDDPAENDKIFRAVKGPDFKSRLKGFIDILGPNPQKGVYDPYFIIRRAILLNSILQSKTPQFFTPDLQIDDALLDALLEIKTYLHGVRSMESILAMSQISGKTRFERSCLPPVSQLNLHVVGWEFMARVQKLKFEGKALDQLTRAVHEDFCAYMSEKGYVYGEKEDDQSDPKTHSSLVDFDRLPAGEQEQNRQFALDIPRKLAQSGYVMIHARTNEPPWVFPDTDLDVLAEMEHYRWVKTKLAQPENWRFGRPTDKPHFIHSDLLPWREQNTEELAQIFSPDEISRIGREALPEPEKDKDRELVRRIPFILGRVGYTVIRLAETE